MTIPLTEILDEIEKRADKTARARSDDFGHDTHELLLWESQQAERMACTDIPKLTRALRVAIEKLEEIGSGKSDSILDRPKPTANFALHKLEQILRGDK